jgi:hypothetical protein
MKAKTFEVRDRGTFIPVLAVKLEPACERDRYLLARAGYGTAPERQSEYVVVWPLIGGIATYDEYGHALAPIVRTLPEAHVYIRDHFDVLESGAVIDVEFILGETAKPKVSEQSTI